MRIFEEEQRFNQWWVQLINLGLLLTLCYFLYKWYILGEPVDKVAADDYQGQTLVIVSFFLGMGIIYLFKLKTTIDKTGIVYRFYPIHRSKKQIDWSDLEKIHV